MESGTSHMDIQVSWWIQRYDLLIQLERSERTKELYLIGAKSIVEIADKVALSALSKTRVVIIRAVLRKRYEPTTVHTKLQSL